MPAEVAVVNPRSSEIWARLSGAIPAAYENAKWIYTALAHAHVPVDPIDEVMLAKENLSRYKVIYVSGRNITRAAAGKLAEWVRAGGVLYTSGGGLARDEANEPLRELEPVLGLQGRAPVEIWYRVQAYGATHLEPYNDPRNALSRPPADAEIVWNGTRLKPVVGREVLRPAAGAEVLARFAGGGAAAVRNRHGKGMAYVVGFFPGLEYSTAVRSDEFDMSRDFDPRIRRFAAFAALECVKPVVDASQPLIEGVFLKNQESGAKAVALMNWAYRVTGKRIVGKRTTTIKSIIPFKDVRVTVRGTGGVKKAASVALGRDLPVERSGDAIAVVLPDIWEGDVLLLE